MAQGAAFHEKQVRRSVELAYEAIRSGKGRPFGAVIVKEGAVVAEAHNEVLAQTDPTAHAEIVAIRRAAKALGTHDLSGCVLYVNGLPCPMCYSAVKWARMHKVFYACTPAELAQTTGIDDTELYGELAKPGPERTRPPAEQVLSVVAESLACYRVWGEKIRSGSGR